MARQTRVFIFGGRGAFHPQCISDGNALGKCTGVREGGKGGKCTGEMHWGNAVLFPSFINSSRGLGEGNPYRSKVPPETYCDTYCDMSLDGTVCSLTRPCLEGFLLSFLLVSGCRPGRA